MSKLAALIGTLGIALSGCSGELWSTNSNSSSDRTTAGGEAEWTLLFYMAADNDQEAYADNSIGHLLAGTADVANHAQVIVLIDRLSEPGTVVFEVVDGEPVTLMEYPEQVTSDSAVLEEFIALGLEQASHENVALVVKSEGLSWRGIGRDNTHDVELPDTLMSPDALAGAVTGKGVDVLVLEGSIMAFMEVVYEMRNAAPYLVASQSKMQPDGIPWHLVLGDLGSVPGMSAEALATAVVDQHLKYYDAKGNKGTPANDTSQNFAALTAFDLAHAVAVATAHSTWADVTALLMDDLYNILPHARDLSDVGHYGSVTDADFQSDIWTFMEQGLILIAEKELSFPELDAAVADYMAAYELLAVHEVHADKFRDVTHGMGIWFPPTWNKYETRDSSDEVFGTTMYYEDPAIGLDWVTDSTWVDYLFAWFNRADALLAGNGNGSSGDEPPKPGVNRRLDDAAGN